MTTIAERDQVAVEEALRDWAQQADMLRRIDVVRDRKRLDLIFVAAEPLYDAETEVIPLIQRVLRLPRQLELDFVVVPERVSAEFAAQPGARIVYEQRPGAPR